MNKAHDLEIKRVKRIIWKLKEREMQEKFERRVEELVDVETTNLRKSFRHGVLKACDDLCGTKNSERMKEINGGRMKK